MSKYQEALDKVRENLRELAGAIYYGSSDLATLQELVDKAEKYDALLEENQILKEGIKEILKKNRLFNHDFDNDKIKAMMEMVEE